MVPTEMMHFIDLSLYFENSRSLVNRKDIIRIKIARNMISEGESLFRIELCDESRHSHMTNWMPREEAAEKFREIWHALGFAGVDVESYLLRNTA